jgi:hypothetical protein
MPKVKANNITMNYEQQGAGGVHPKSETRS